MVGDVGEREFGFGAGQPDGADEDAEPVFLERNPLQQVPGLNI